MESNLEGEAYSKHKVEITFTSSICGLLSRSSAAVDRFQYRASAVLDVRREVVVELVKIFLIVEIALFEDAH
jgi:hypothetical protein